MATIALGLLAYDLAGDRAALVLGTVFTIKMIAYVGIAPIAGAFANRWPRRAMLGSLDVIRAVVALCLPFVIEIWQVYALIFALQSASAAFTPTFHDTIPDIHPEEGRYTRALSLSRVAYDLENLISPSLAALLLTFVSYQVLFYGTDLGFTGSGSALPKQRNRHSHQAAGAPSPDGHNPRVPRDRWRGAIRLLASRHPLGLGIGRRI